MLLLQKEDFKPTDELLQLAARETYLLAALKGDHYKDDWQWFRIATIPEVPSSGALLVWHHLLFVLSAYKGSHANGLVI